jgi:hypothetical protein
MLAPRIQSHTLFLFGNCEGMMHSAVRIVYRSSRHRLDDRWDCNVPGLVSGVGCDSQFALVVVASCEHLALAVNKR